MNRLAITTSDVQIITDKTLRYAQILLKKIRKELNKQPHQYVSIREFCDYMGLDFREVTELLKAKRYR